MFKPISLTGLYGGTQETFVRVGKGEINSPDGSREFFVAQKAGRDEKYSVWLPEGMAMPPGEFQLVRASDDTNTLITRLLAPKGKPIRAGDLIVSAANRSPLPWLVSVSYEISQGENGEVAILRAIDGLSV